MTVITKVGGAFLVNTTTQGHQAPNSIATLADGNFRGDVDLPITGANGVVRHQARESILRRLPNSTF